MRRLARPGEDGRPAAELLDVTGAQPGEVAARFVP
jgi:hypothetical protein